MSKFERDIAAVILISLVIAGCSIGWHFLKAWILTRGV